MPTAPGDLVPEDDPIGHWVAVPEDPTGREDLAPGIPILGVDRPAIPVPIGLGVDPPGEMPSRLRLEAAAAIPIGLATNLGAAARGEPPIAVVVARGVESPTVASEPQRPHLHQNPKLVPTAFLCAWE